MNDPISVPKINEISEALRKVRGPFCGTLTENHRTCINAHISRFSNVFESLRCVSSYDPDEVLDLITSAGSGSEEYVLALDTVAATEGYICLAGRNFAIVGIAACYGWEFDSKLSGWSNPWVPVTRLILDGVCVTYVIKDSDTSWMLEMRVSTSASDVVFPVVSAGSADAGGRKLP
jgi:hypothetical protein